MARASDVARQAVTAGGAIFQVVAPAFGAADIGRVSDANPTLITPAGWAFAIWTPIFAGSFAYAVWQALPRQRERPLLRRIGWPLAGAFLGNGAWELLFPAERFLLAEAVILGILTLLVLAWRELFAAAPLRDDERWLAALPLGLLFGWVTVAAAVATATTWVALGGPAGGAAETVLDVVLVAGAVALAVWATRRGRAALGPVALACPAAVLWGLAASAIANAPESAITTGAAVAGALVVAGAALTARGHARRAVLAR